MQAGCWRFDSSQLHQNKGTKMEQFGKMDSIKYTVDDEGVLTMKIDTWSDIGPSASGKTIMIASSGGNAKLNVGNEVDGDDIIYIGLNIYRYPPKTNIM